jgi:hypothetical protein
LSSSFLAREKGLFNQLPVRKPSPIIPSADLTDAQNTSAQMSCFDPPWRQLFRPFPLALVALAIMVALWGYGYKLSLYHPHPTPSSLASVAKLWDGPRNTFQAAASRLTTKSRLIPGSHTLWVSPQPLPHPDRGVALVLPPRMCGARYSNSPIPSRSPPSRFRLA